ncbi:Sulfite exporter TauE/SafE family protein 3 [Citrus sinensis]|uniref:Sulfite exporter TauE/SafE family protein 3 n=1 Tax=Citrus sinensis TaxID=2711 RepID=A0ACB8J3H3_CITSI|nr:Sulfite exporter TauE/SafE family protein 3 [Citrus sinensis]
MAQIRMNRRSLAAAVAVWMVFLGLIMMEKLSNAERLLKDKDPQVFADEKETRPGFLCRVAHFLWQSGESSYEPVWPEMQFGWKVVVGSIVGFFGAALGSVGGVGGGGIFVPMLTLIIGFDPKSATAISKCMIMGAAGSTVYYNLRLRHPTLDMPLIDYDLALLFQPMLMLGISIGVAFNVMFADWMVTVLLIILFIGTSTKALFKGIDTWKKETLMKKEAAKVLESESKAADVDGQDYKQLPSGPSTVHDEEVPIIKNIYWKELSLLLYVWLGFLAVQLAKEYVVPCSITYWILNALQVPIAVSVALFEAICLYKGTRVIASKGKEITNWKIHQIVFYCFCGIVAGMVGGLLGLGGGFILGPLFLELGIPPQVCTKLLSQGQMEGGGNNFEVSQRMYQHHLITANLNPFFAGSKRNINICNDFLILNVCCAILSSRSFPGPLCCFFYFSCNLCCLRRPARSEKDNCSPREGLNNRFHISFDNLRERNQFRWIWHRKHG